MLRTLLENTPTHIYTHVMTNIELSSVFSLNCRQYFFTFTLFHTILNEYNKLIMLYSENTKIVCYNLGSFIYVKCVAAKVAKLADAFELAAIFYVLN